MNERLFLVSVQLAMLRLNHLFKPIVSKSVKWLIWVAKMDLRTCIICEEKNGTIYSIEENVKGILPVHYYCRCKLDTMSAILNGAATIDAMDGADYSINILENCRLIILSVSRQKE